MTNESMQWVHGSQWQAGHSPGQSRLVSGVWHSQPRYTTWTAAAKSSALQEHGWPGSSRTSELDSICQAGWKV